MTNIYLISHPYLQNAVFSHFSSMFLLGGTANIPKTRKNSTKCTTYHPSPTKSLIERFATFALSVFSSLFLKLKHLSLILIQKSTELKSLQN